MGKIWEVLKYFVGIFLIAIAIGGFMYLVAQIVIAIFGINPFSV